MPAHPCMRPEVMCIHWTDASTRALHPCAWHTGTDTRYPALTHFTRTRTRSLSLSLSLMTATRTRSSWCALAFARTGQRRTALPLPSSEACSAPPPSPPLACSFCARPRRSSFSQSVCQSVSPNSRALSASFPSARHPAADHAEEEGCARDLARRGFALRVQHQCGLRRAAGWPRATGRERRDGTGWIRCEMQQGGGSARRSPTSRSRWAR